MNQSSVVRTALFPPATSFPKVILLLELIAAIPLTLAAQQPANAPDQTSGSANRVTPATSTSNDRLFFALPNYMTVAKGATAKPLSSGGKFRLVTKSSFDYGQFAWYGVLAGISQANNTDEEYGQGASGYAKRYAAEFADGTIENYISMAVLPSLLHQDPRYYQLGEGGFFKRAGYAVSRIVVTRGDSGHGQFNFSEVFGSATAAGISTFSYRPEGDRRLSNALTNWGTQVGYDALGNLIKEFWPDIRRKLHKSN